MDIIPHRHLLVTGWRSMMQVLMVLELKITMNEYYFQGHYPGMPVMPGVIIIETMAQVGSYPAIP